MGEGQGGRLLGGIDGGRVAENWGQGIRRQLLQLGLWARGNFLEGVPGPSRLGGGLGEPGMAAPVWAPVASGLIQQALALGKRAVLLWNALRHELLKYLDWRPRVFYAIRRQVSRLRTSGMASAEGSESCGSERVGRPGRCLGWPFDAWRERGERPRKGPRSPAQSRPRGP